MKEKGGGSQLGSIVKAIEDLEKKVSNYLQQLQGSFSIAEEKNEQETAQETDLTKLKETLEQIKKKKKS